MTIINQKGKGKKKMTINKHLFRNKILTTTLRKIIKEIDVDDVIDQGNTICLRFDNDEIHFYIQGALAVCIENTVKKQMTTAKILILE
jgi:hypothetical protein